MHFIFSLLLARRKSYSLPKCWKHVLFQFALPYQIAQTVVPVGSNSEELYHNIAKRTNLLIGCRRVYPDSGWFWLAVHNRSSVFLIERGSCLDKVFVWRVT